MLEHRKFPRYVFGHEVSGSIYRIVEILGQEIYFWCI